MSAATCGIMAKKKDPSLKQPLLCLRNVTKFRGRSAVLRNLNLEIHQGDSILITGSNGAGKTTALRILAGLSRPTTGQVIASPDLRIAYLGHSTFLYPRLSALENLLFWARLYQQDTSHQNLRTILARAGLEKFSSLPAGLFSRGMSQRLNFARLLLIQPHVYLLDEPFTGMDLESRQLMQSELRQALEEGGAVVMVTHSLAEDRLPDSSVLVLCNGKLGLDPGSKQGC